jgi:Tfp pilus assembly protein FimV
VALMRASVTSTPVVAPRATLQPPPVASAPALPPPLASPPWSYTVQPNESCWAIAERAEPDPAKTGRLWASIVALNPTLCSSRREDLLRPGSIIAIPPTVQPAALIQ